MFTALFFLNAFFLYVIAIHTLSLPNTIVGNRNIGLQSTLTIRPIINSIYRSPFKLAVNSKIYDVTYQDLGIYLDQDALINDIFASNKQSLLASLKQFAILLIFPRTIHIPLSFSQEFYDFITKTNTATQQGSDLKYVDQENKTVNLVSKEQQYEVNTALLEKQLELHFGAAPETITAHMMPLASRAYHDVASANTGLRNAYAMPLTVIIGSSNKNRFITLSPDDLKRYTVASVSATPEAMTFSINRDPFRNDLKMALAVFNTPMNMETAYEHVGNGIESALLTRYVGTPIDSVKVSVDDGPNTDGSVAAAYIEVDISQQKMFTFKGGNLVRTYRVSTGKDYPTPTGRFTILNKAGVGYSSIYHVWMPYWMGFAYSNELHAYFGIHELPYYYAGDTKIQRPRDFIGAPNTGGCIALDIGDAKEVYQFADIGTPVVIYQ